MTWKRDLAMASLVGFAAQLGLRAADWVCDRVLEPLVDGDDDDPIETEACADCGHVRECIKGETDRRSSP